MKNRGGIENVPFLDFCQIKIVSGSENVPFLDFCQLKIASGSEKWLSLTQQSLLFKILMIPWHHINF